MENENKNPVMWSDFFTLVLPPPPPPPSMMVSGQISSIQASLPLSSPAPHLPPTILQLSFSLVMSFCIQAVILRIAAIAGKAPPSPDGLLGFCPAPWLWARIRLRRKFHQIAAPSIDTEPHRDPPILPPDRDTVQLCFPGWPLQFSAWLDLVSTLKLMSRSVHMESEEVPMESDEVLVSHHLSQIKPMSFYTQAGKLSRPTDQAVPLSRATKLSRARYLDQAADPGQASISLIICLSLVFGVWELVFGSRTKPALAAAPSQLTLHWDPGAISTVFCRSLRLGGVEPAVYETIKVDDGVDPFVRHSV